MHKLALQNSGCAFKAVENQRAAPNAVFQQLLNFS